MTITATDDTRTELWGVTRIPWTAENGSNTSTWYAEGTATGYGWYCFEVDTVTELVDELHVLGIPLSAFAMHYWDTNRGPVLTSTVG